MRDIRDLLRANKITNYLRSQVGRPWNKVFSELCSMADSRSDEGYRLRERIRWNVTTDCFTSEDGTISYSSRWLGRRPVDGLYVHPTTGILCYKESPSYGSWMSPRPWEKEINYIALDDGINLIKDDNGNWYKHWTEKREEGYKNDSGEIVKYTREIAHKQALNHKEIKHVNEHLLRYGTNKDLLARLNGLYIPAYKWS